MASEGNFVDGLFPAWPLSRDSIIVPRLVVALTLAVRVLAIRILTVRFPG